MVDRADLEIDGLDGTKAALDVAAVIGCSTKRVIVAVVSRRLVLFGAADFRRKAAHCVRLV